MKKAVLLLATTLLLGAIAVTAWVEREAGFSDEIALALAQGFKAAGLAVDRAIMAGETPAEPQGYALVAGVSNTCWAAPDRSTGVRTHRSPAQPPR